MKVTVCIGAALGFLVLATTGNAQTKKAAAQQLPAAVNGPSLDETIEFLNKKLQAVPAGFSITSDDFPPTAITSYTANGIYKVSIASTQSKITIDGTGSTISNYSPDSPAYGHGFYEAKTYSATTTFNLKELVPTVSIQNALAYPFMSTIMTQIAQTKIPLSVTIKLTCTNGNCFSTGERREGNINNSFPYPKDHTGPSEFRFNSSALLIPVNDPELAERLKKAFEHAIELSGGKREAF
jgi:hypothetical protein